MKYSYITWIFVVTFASNKSIICQFVSDVYVNKNVVYIVSDYQANAKSADQACSSSGGTLSDVSNSALKQKLIDYLVDKFIPSDLRIIKIFQNIENPSFFKYRLEARRHLDRQYIGHWSRPQKGALKSLRLYRRAVPGFSFELSFCYYHNRDLVTVVSCHSGWKTNFNSFSGTNTTTNKTIKMTLYLSDGSPYHSKLELGYGNIQSGYILRNYFNIPDISVFIGARSDVNQTNWFWNNGAMLNESLLSPSNASVCQQLAWPLTYDNGVNLHSRDCMEKTNFLCQVKFTFQARGVSTCKESYLHIQWNPIRLNEISRSSSSYYLKIDVVGHRISRTAMLNETEIIINGLDSKTNYVVQAILKHKTSGHEELLATSATIIKSEEIDPTMQAQVVNSTLFEECLIEWKQEMSSGCPTSYKIHASSEDKTISFDVDMPRLNDKNITEEIIMRDVDLQFFQRNAKVCFQLEAMTCGRKNNLINVKGSCLAVFNCSRPIKQFVVTGSNRNSIIIGCVLGGVIIILLLCIIRLKRSNSRKYMQHDDVQYIVRDDR